jgi:hypothetical protein
MILNSDKTRAHKTDCNPVHAKDRAASRRPNPHIAQYMHVVDWKRISQQWSTERRTAGSQRTEFWGGVLVHEHSQKLTPTRLEPRGCEQALAAAV